ncbi:MAG: TonB family protein [Fibrobacterota bacterium]
MAFQVILKRTSDTDTLDRVAAEVANMSGAPAEQVKKALAAKSISIGKDFSKEKAEEMKSRFDALGVEAVIKNLAGSAAPADNSGAADGDAAVKSSGDSPAPRPAGVDDDEEDEEEGVLLTKEEYVKAMNSRSDIFYTEKENRLKVVLPIVLIAFFWIGFFFKTYKFISGSEGDFFKTNENKPNVTLGEDVVLEDEEKKEKKKKKEKIEKEKKTLKPKKEQKVKSRNNGGGGGSARSRVMKKGVLGRLSGPITANDVANADPLARGGHAKGVDALLSGSSGIKQGGGGGAGRATSAGIGFGGTGSSSGFGGGSGQADLSGLSGSDAAQTTEIKRKSPKKISKTRNASASGMSGGRSRANIMRTVRNNMASLKYAFNRRLKAKPGIEGKVKVNWAIDEHGKVLRCKVVSSTINDKTFEQTVVTKIKSWNFGPIDIPGDVTQVTYPFVFTQ